MQGEEEAADRWRVFNICAVNPEDVVVEERAGMSRWRAGASGQSDEVRRAQGEMTGGVAEPCWEVRGACRDKAIGSERWRDQLKVLGMVRADSDPSTCWCFLVSRVFGEPLGLSKGT